MIAWESWTLQRVFHIASDIPDGTPDYAETVASNGYSFKKDHTTDNVLGVRLAHLCRNESGLDANILQEVVNGTNHMSRRVMFTMGELLFSEGSARRAAFPIEEVETN